MCTAQRSELFSVYVIQHTKSCGHRVANLFIALKLSRYANGGKERKRKNENRKNKWEKCTAGVNEGK